MRFRIPLDIPKALYDLKITSGCGYEYVETVSVSVVSAAGR